MNTGLATPRPHWRHFIVTIVSPAIVTFALFLVLIGAVILPAMEENFIERKKEMLRALTQAACSELSGLREQERQGALSRTAAQQAAIARLRNLRYGEDGKDYCWIPLHVIDGNHEDHGWLRRALLTGAAKTWRREMNLIYQPRPSVAEFGTSRIGFLGGALHVDRPPRHNWRSGFPNYIQRRDREHAVRLFNQQQPELIVTHSCPSRIGIGIRSADEMQPGVAQHITAAGFDAGPPDDCGEVGLGRLRLQLSYKPEVLHAGRRGSQSLRFPRTPEARNRQRRAC